MSERNRDKAIFLLRGQLVSWDEILLAFQAGWRTWQGREVSHG